MTSAVLTPERRGALIELGNGRWKKQILPIGSINYRGRKITFDRDYLSGIVRSFKQQACGPVPFQLADAKNTHTNDPERRRGTIVDLEASPDGLYAVVDLDEEGEKLIKQYPDLGVSARIYENYERSDGRFFPAALQHVLGTLDPHVSGMRPWQAVALSNDVSGPVVDLSDSEFEDGEEEGETVATKSTLKTILSKLNESGDEAELTDDELDQLLAITDAMSTNQPTSSSDSDESDDELTDEELDKLIAEAEAEISEDPSDDDTEVEEEEEESDEGGEKVTDAKLIAATQKHQRALELASQKIDKQAIELAAVKAELAAQRFTSEQRTFAQLGIPPRITELARPILEGDDDGHVIQLANGDEVDAGAIMRTVLTELGNTFRALDLSELLGNGLDEPTDDEAEARKQSDEETKSFVQNVRSNYSF